MSKPAKEDGAGVIKGEMEPGVYWCREYRFAPIHFRRKSEYFFMKGVMSTRDTG